jgi:hypothetical protein
MVQLGRGWWILGAAGALAGLASVGACASKGGDATGSGESDFHEVPIACDDAGLRSFDQVKQSVYAASPQNRVYAQGTMPSRGNPASSAVNALSGGFDHDGSQILQCTRDYRANPSNADKIIHAPGICASATWTIGANAVGVDRSQGGARLPYTGLFAPGTELNAIVRLSSGTNVPAPNARLLQPSWGIAVKLFATPPSRPDVPARTAQIVMFDQNGVDGTSSREMLRSDDPSQPHFFSNWLFGDGVFAQASLAIFNRFVAPHTQLGQPIKQEARLQALDEVARITGTGGDVPIESAHYPSILKIQLAESTPALDQVASRAATGVDLSADFRDQLLAYADGEIAFDVIADNDAQGPAALRSAGTEAKIGGLRLDHMVVSDVCDKLLTFQHRRNGEVFTGWRPGDGGE